MSVLAEFSSLVELLYQAAGDPERWELFVDRFYGTMDATRGALTAVAQDAALGKVVLRGYTESEVLAYSDYFWQHDVVLEAGLQTMKCRDQWIGRVEEIVPSRKLEASEIYNDYYRRLEMHYASCLMIGETGPYAALGLAAWRPKNSGSFNEEQLHLVELLAPHLRQAFLLHAKLDALGTQKTALETAMQATGVALFALRADGVLITATPAAERLLRKGVFTLRAGQLHVPDRESDDRLRKLIAGASRTVRADTKKSESPVSKPGGSLLLKQAQTPVGLQVQILPIFPVKATRSLNSTVLVFVADPGAAPPSRTAVLHDLYGLSPLEARLADLFLQGIELKEAADVLKMTYANTRFHLKQIFRKTNTSRQTELLRLLLCIPA